MASTPADTITLHEGSSAEVLTRNHRLTDDVVIKAEEEFNTLARQLTSHSQRDAKNLSQGSSGDHPTDLEKGNGTDASEVFDLREYLTSSNDAYQKAGIKHKVRSSTTRALPRTNDACSVLA